MPIPQSDINSVLNHILPVLGRYRNRKSPREAKVPFMLGMTGLQGSGKSTWAASLVSTLEQECGLKAITVSLDDLYNTHENLVKVRDRNPENQLLRTRGQPGTHDNQLAERFFRSLRQPSTEPLAIPAFDKSQFSGEGDRVPQGQWKTVLRDPPMDIVIFEGWCVGFRPISPQEIEDKWHDSVKTHKASYSQDQEESYTTNTLWRHALEHLISVNDNLTSYVKSFMDPSHFDFLIHLDTDDLSNVYRWRIEQERALRKVKNFGMTDEQVIAFVQGYMPSYELYLDGLRNYAFVPAKSWSDEGLCHHLRVVLGRERQIEGLHDLFSQNKR
ncbi:MAG: hypothetical protein MMC23_003038 [Stictis urceolatum]|nr:hypothetical protein [Stictis urceolata]